MHVAIIWQRFLPYHIARIKHLNQKLEELGHKLHAIEVATQDLSYGFPEKPLAENGFSRVCCFPGTLYHQHTAKEIHKKVLDTLYLLKSDVVFAPATPFPEGMASLAYRLATGNLSVLMDDTWEHSDKKGRFVKLVKRLLHSNADVAFVPSVSHLSYYVKLGFPPERVVFGVDVVDNDYFFEKSCKARNEAFSIRKSKNLPDRYFLFVGRFLPRKGLDSLVMAYQIYRNKIHAEPWDLVLVGDGNYIDTISRLAQDISGIHFSGPRYGEDLCEYYGLANTAIIPSEIDPWGLVVNEAMASGLPVLVSRGCGSARTLIREGENGWTFEPGATEEIAALMAKMSSLPDSALQEMGQASRQIVAQWGLDRFVDGALAALEIPRRPNARFLSNLLTRLWKGHVRLN